MNLIIDIGNTRAKLAVFDQDRLIQSVVCFKENLDGHQKALRREFPKIDSGILANVATPEDGYESALSGLSGTTINLSDRTKVPFRNAYTSPKTLGLDRIALAAAAVSNYPQKNVLVIDAGTCVTYDLVTASKTYLGGAISPGLNMRFRALNNFTANLPLLRADDEKEIRSMGKNTIESLELGVIQGLIYEIDGFIYRFKEKYPDLTLILTGGDYEILSKRLKNTIFAHKNFLLTGLNSILEFNKH